MVSLHVGRVNPGGPHILGIKFIRESGDQNFIVKMGRKFI